MSYRTFRTSSDGAVWQVLGEHLDRIAADRGAADVRILDIGGGTGVYAVPLAERGYTVTVVDPSPDALATLRRRAFSSGVTERVSAILGDADSIEGHDLSADVVLCHHILEYVDDPVRTLRSASAILRPGGIVSVLIQLRAGAVLARALTGRAAEAAAILNDPDGRTGAQDPVLRRLDVDSAEALVATAGLSTAHFAGVDILTGLADSAADPQRGGVLARLEQSIAAMSPYRDVAANGHLIAVRQDD